MLGMASFLSGIALEALAGFTKKLGGHAQVDLRMPQLDVAQIDRQVMQEPLHVGTLLIPVRKVRNGVATPLRQGTYPVGGVFGVGGCQAVV